MREKRVGRLASPTDSSPCMHMHVPDYQYSTVSTNSLVLNFDPI